LDRWLLAGMARPYGVVPAEPPPIVGGSHDPLLQWALNESRAGLAILPEGSEAGYRRFLRGEVIATAIHFHDVHNPEKDANVERVKREATLYDAVLIGFATREQGLLVASGNPLKLSGLPSAVQNSARFVVRPEGAGAQQLLTALLRRDGLSVEALDRVSTAPTGLDIAQAIRAGHADCGVATRAVAVAAGLDFLPLATEHFDLLLRQRDFFRPALQAFVAMLVQPVLAATARELGGLDVSGAGKVRWAP
jgi:molybdate-binding protein